MEELKKELIEAINRKNFIFKSGVFVIKFKHTFIGYVKDKKASPITYDAFVHVLDEVNDKIGEMYSLEEFISKFDYGYNHVLEAIDYIGTLPAGTESQITVSETYKDYLDSPLEIIGEDEVHLGTIGKAKNEETGETIITFLSSDNSIATLTVINSDNDGKADLKLISDKLLEYIDKI